MKAQKEAIALDRFIEDPLKRKIYTLVKRPLNKILSIDSLNNLYRQTSHCTSQRVCFDTWLEFLNIRLDYNEHDLERVPKRGSLLVIANHPFGGLDGIILAALVLRVRGDLKLLGNYFLQAIPEMNEFIIPVDPFHSKHSVRKNMKALRASISWLAQGNTLGMFPAGEVSHLRLRTAHISDPPWTSHLASLIRRSGATTLPIYFDGRNSVLFQLAGLVHPRLRTALLPREIFHKRATPIRLRIGKPIPWEDIARLDNTHTIVEYLRLATHIQKYRNGTHKAFYHVGLPQPTKRIFRSVIPPPVSPEILAEEIGRIPQDYRMLTHGAYDIYCVAANHIPVVLREIARLREETFREIGEGTGKAIDRDTFDEHYLHLFMWNREAAEIVGAYRIGPTDDILQRFGVRGLYTSTLFKFKGGLIEKLNPALELGRSFIRSHYQKRYNALALLWKGIGGYIARHPRYCILFGPVSISNDYHAVSKNLLISFLMSTKRHPLLSPYLVPRHPVQQRTCRGIDTRIVNASCFSLEDVDALISEIEPNRKGVPVLLRHYLNLNGTILNCNLDKRFSRAIDSLMVVDLRSTDPKLLRRFMGVRGYEHFTRYHHTKPTPITSRVEGNLCSV